MTVQYVFTQKEIDKAIDGMKEMRKISLMCRDAKDDESNREFYLRAKGFEEALRILGIIK